MENPEEPTFQASGWDANQPSRRTNGQRPTLLRPVAQREQRLLALQLRTATGDGDDLLDGQERCAALLGQRAGRRHERAVVAAVPAQMG